MQNFHAYPLPESTASFQSAEPSLTKIRGLLDTNIQALRQQSLNDNLYIRQTEALSFAFREGRRLEHLNLDHLFLTDEVLEGLAELCPNIKDLSLKNSQITTVKPFSSMEKLEVLDVQGCVHFQDAEELLAFKKLKKLCLNGSGVSRAFQSIQAQFVAFGTACEVLDIPLIGPQEVEGPTVQLALQILKRAGNFSWKIEEGYLSCDTELLVSPNDGHLYQKAAVTFIRTVKEITGLGLKTIRPYLKNPQTRRLSVAITDAEQIRKLADLVQPQVILLDPKTKMPRSLSSIAATLCVLIPEGYSKKTLEKHGPTPDTKLPFPLIDISDECLTIKLPESLSGDFYSSLQHIVGKEPIQINERKFEKNYVVKFTIPLEELRQFLQDKLGLTTVSYSESIQTPIIEDIIKARIGTIGELNETAKNKLRGR